MAQEPGSASRVADTEQHSVNTENRVTQDSGRGEQKIGKRKRCCSKPETSSTVVPKGITKTQRHIL
jgi:hypothetical protein